MALTTEQLAWLHSEVGSAATDEDLNARYSRLESVRDVAIEVLRERRAQLLESPLKVSVDGVASVDFGENVKALERRISALVQMDDDPSDDDGEGEVGTAEGADRGFTAIRLTRTRGR